MSKQIEISDEAWTILREHMHDSGQHIGEKSEMDELFAESQAAWTIGSAKAKAAYAVIRKRVYGY